MRIAVAASVVLTCAPQPASATSTPSPTTTVAPASPSVAMTPTAIPSPPPGRAPYCAVDDVLTAERDDARPQVTVLDWTNALPRSYEPPDLVSALDGSATVSTFAIIPEDVSAADMQIVKGNPGYEAVLAADARALLRGIVYPDLAALRAAARAAGHPLVIVSAYRSYTQQEFTFKYWVGVGGYEQALRSSARPGHSEHQLGTTLDFGDGTAAPWEYDD